MTSANKAMTQQTSRGRVILSRFGTLIETILIFILLISGVGFIFILRAADISSIPFLPVGIGVEIIAIIIIGLYVYFRFLRQDRIETS